MRLSEITAITPPEVPVASVPFRGAELDIHRISVRDILFVMNKAPALVEAWMLDEDDPERLQVLISAIGHIGDEVISRLVRSGLRVSQTELHEAALDTDEEIEILLAVLRNSIPDKPLGKLLGGLGQMSSQFARFAG